MYSLWRQPLNVGLDDLFWPSPIFAVDQRDWYCTTWLHMDLHYRF